MSEWKTALRVIVRDNATTLNVVLAVARSNFLIYSALFVVLEVQTRACRVECGTLRFLGRELNAGFCFPEIRLAFADLNIHFSNYSAVAVSGNELRKKRHINATLIN